MSDAADRPARKALGRGIGSALNREDADKTSKLLGKVTPAKLRVPESGPPPTTTLLLPPSTNSPIAPQRDFARVANSINRDALPAGLFKGTSKKLYDALYQRTRGAIIPVRIIQAKQGDMMEWAGISHNTLRGHLRHLEAIGLIVKKWELGDNDGARYEVFIPEELPPPTTTSYPLPPPPTSDHKLDGGTTQKMVEGGGGQTVEESTTSGNPKTSFKTIDQIDDEFGQRLRALERELTGKSSPSAKWTPLFDLLADELKTAASRTGSVSDAPAFFAEHLRRRLAKPDAPVRTGKRAVVATEPASLAPDEIAPPAPNDVEEYEQLRKELDGK